MKNLVIYYSLEGNTNLIAQTISKEINADILELIPKKEFPSTGFKKYLWGGKSVIFKQKPTLINKDKDINIYDNIFIGTPIWAGTYASPLNTFIDNYKISNKNIALFACHGGGGVGKCFEKFKEAFPNNNFIGEINFLDPLKNNTDENISKTKDWIKLLNI
jgi:flavodoxin